MDPIQKSSPTAVLPTAIPGELKYVQVAAGDKFTCAITTAGTVQCFGDNEYGQLGNGRSGFGAKELRPVTVLNSSDEPLSGIIDIKAGSQHMLALKSDGTVWAWGYNGNGFASVDSCALGNGIGPNRSKAAQVAGLSGVTMIGAGHHTGFAYAPSDVWGWGRNNRGTLGVPGFGGLWRERLLIASNPPWMIAGGYDATCVIGSGTLLAECWGNNANGAVGNPGTLGSGVVVPTPVAGLSFVRSITTNGKLTFAVGLFGALYVWGNDSYASAGTGGTGGMINTPAVIPSISSVREVKTNYSVAHQTCAKVFVLGTLGDDLYCWGHGTPGDGTPGPTTTKTPTRVSSLAGGVLNFAVGYQHICAIDTSLNLYCWGTNLEGQLGSGDLVKRDNPNLVK